jgi:hypothetical protein
MEPSNSQMEDRGNANLAKRLRVPYGGRFPHFRDPWCDTLVKHCLGDGRGQLGARWSYDTRTRFLRK